MFALAIADDLTGAAETAAAIVRATRKPVRVVLPGDLPAEGDVVLLPCRRSKPARVRQAAQRILLSDRGTVFVKIDSTLRGPWVELVESLARRLRCEPLICSAFPARGRTVERGVPLVDGRPLFRDVSFREEIVGEGELETIADLMTQRAPEMRAEIRDAVRDDDLDAIAREARMREHRLLVGSAGLAEAFARAVRGETSRDSDVLLDAPRARGPVAIAAGSRAAATARQVAAVGERATTLRGKGLRALARRALEVADGGTVVACGGETALQVLYALHARGAVVYGEAAPAVVLTRPIGADVTLLTKSGSLGSDDALVLALATLGL